MSWCPLGWNNRAVIGFVNVNRGFRHDPWHAWTVVPHGRFGSGFVNTNVVSAARIDVRTRSAFVVRDTSPDFRGYAVPRSGAPISAAGSRAPVGSVGGDAAAFSRSRGVTTPGGSATASTDPSAAFRSRRSNGAALTGPGYPAASREPRSMSTVPSPSRQAVPRSREGSAVAAPGVATSETRSPGERRAVPRGSVSPGAVSAPSPAPASPGRTETYRAVPRENRGDSTPYAPSPSSGAPGQRSNPYRSPSYEAPASAPRAVPRSAPEYVGGSSPGSRSRPGPEHSAPAPAPSGPPPSAAPSRSSGGPPPAASSGGESRSRGGGAVTGRAVPRGRGHSFAMNSFAAPVSSSVLDRRGPWNRDSILFACG